MNDERLSRHLRQENADLKSENSRLKMQVETQDSRMREKNNEVLRLLNQIATDMIRRDDVDRLVAEAVAKVTADYEERMKAMAAEYEAKISELQNGKGNKGNRKSSGRLGNDLARKGGNVICSTMEEAVQRIQEEMNKATLMQDMAFGGGSEKLSSEQKPAVGPVEGIADDDSLIGKPAVSGNYGERAHEPKTRPADYSNYVQVEKDDEVHVDCYPEGCGMESRVYGTRTNVIWELSLPRFKKILCHLHQCQVNGKKVWGKMPNRDSLLRGTHMGTQYAVNLILNKFLNGMAESRTGKSLEHLTGAAVPRQTNNTIVNNMLTRLRKIFEPAFRSHILADPYLATDETVGDVFVDDNGETHLRTRYFWGFRTSRTNLVYFIYDKGSRSRKVILDFLKEFIGTIQTDGASMYKIFEKDPTLHVTRLSCLVHIRRYFIKAMKFEDETGIARQFLERIRVIYTFEKSFRKLKDEERRKQRALNVIPVLNDMYQDLLHYANNATGKCGELLLRAINYARAEWNGLIKYTEDGRYRVDNNYAEQCMRDLACGRKNFLFCGSDNAAQNLAFAYSLTQSCKFNKINPYDYWADLIDNVGREGVDLNSFVHSRWQKHV